MEISAGKKAPINLPQAGLGKSHSVANIEFKAKSLHFNQRKAELERIERENQKIAKKIFCLKSDLNKDGFRRDFNKHEAIKNNLQRIKKKRMPAYAGRPGALPPIEDVRQRQGSAPTSSGDPRDAGRGHQSQESVSDYHTVVYGGANQPGSSVDLGKGSKSSVTSRT